MKAYKTALTILVLAILQISVLNYFKIMNVKPDLLLCFVIFTNLYFGARMGLLIGIICGLIVDVFSIGIFGANTFLFALLGYRLDNIKTGLYKDNFAVHIIIGFLASVILFSCYRLIAVISGVSLNNFLVSLRIIILTSVYTALVLPIMCSIFKKIYPQSIKSV